MTPALATDENNVSAVVRAVVSQFFFLLQNFFKCIFCFQFKCDLCGEDSPCAACAQASPSHQQSQRTEGTEKFLEVKEK